MLDKTLAMFALVLLVAFLGTVVVFVKEIDLTVIIVIVVLMAAYEITHDLRKTDGKP